MAQNNKEIVIAVMGLTGVGKSTFIRTLTRRNDIVIGHSLVSETSSVKEYRFHDRGVNYILVDTPGFDDTYLSDEDVTTKILTWLESSYRKKSLLNGVLYLHRLSDKRMGGSALSNLRMFRKLCGADALKNVILGTTFWETLSQSDIDIREAELKDPKKDFWAKMVAKGSQIRKISQDRDSCLKIVREIADNHKVVFQVQDDIVNHGVGIAAAAREAVTESQRTQKAFDDDVQVLLEKIRNAKKPSAKKTRPRFDSLDFDILEEEKRWDKDLRDQQQRELRDLERKVQQQDESIKQKKADRLVAETRKKNKALQKNGNCKQHKPPKTSKPRCSVCYSKIGNKGFYHCCLCPNQCFLQCVDCGHQCPDDMHPEMELIKSRIFGFI